MSDLESSLGSIGEGQDARVLRRRLNRRRMLQASALAGVGAAGFALVGCGDDDEEAATAQAEEVTAEEAPAAEAVPAGFASGTYEKVPPKSAKDTIVLGVSASPIAVDPDFGHGSPQTWESWMGMMDKAIRFAWADYPFDEPPEGKGVGYVSFTEIVPFMFEGWEFNEDFSSATLHIRPGVKSILGNEFTAEDVAYRVDRAFALGAIGAFFMNVTTVDPAHAYDIIDDHTITWHSTGPQPLLVPIWANSAWGAWDSKEAKKHATEEDPWAVGWSAQNLVFYGAHAVEEFVPGDHVSLKANPNYFRGEAPLKKVVYKEIPQPSNRLAAVQSGETDAAYGLPAELWIQARDEQIQHPIAIKGNLIFFAFMNSLRDPWKDPRTRQALNWAAPRNDILKTAFGGLGAPWTTVMTSIFPGVDSSVVPWGADPNFEEAKRLLDAAGQGDGFDVTLDYDVSVVQYERMAILLQDAGKNIGVNIGLNPQANASYAAEATGKQKTFGLWQDAYIQPDPIYFLTLGYDSGLGGINNYGQLDDPQLNALLDDAKATLTIEDRSEKAKAIQQRVVELAPYIWLTEPYYTNVLNKNLQGFRWHTTQETYFSDMYFT